MDGNKDESERCIAIAKRFIDEGKRDVAVKYLQKAERLYPSQKAKELMELLNKLNGTTSMGGSGAAKCQSTENGDAGHHENRSSEANNLSDSSEPKHEYTKEQLEAVKRVKKCKDYYEILGVTKEATENDFKKQYKKLALQFHPDKNKAPGATEAFKAIGNAFAVLSDKEKRQRYDTCGANEEQHVTTRNRRGNTYYEYDYTRGCEADMTAEELFNMFFGRGFASEDVYVRRGNRWARGEPRNSEHREQQNNYNAVLQMLPILILIVLSLTSSLFQSDPPYSLLESSKYPISRQTQNLHVAYYVKENFLAENKNVRRIEQQVEEEYVANLRASCFREMNYKETMVWRARQLRDDSQLKKANGMKTPSCEALMKMRS